MSVHLWSTPTTPLCRWDGRDEGNDQCQDCLHLSAGQKYNGNDARLQKLMLKVECSNCGDPWVEGHDCTWSMDAAMAAVEGAAEVIGWRFMRLDRHGDEWSASAEPSPPYSHGWGKYGYTTTWLGVGATAPTQVVALRDLAHKLEALR